MAEITGDQAQQIINLLGEIKSELIALNEKLGDYNQPLPVHVVSGNIQVEGTVQTIER